MAMYRVTVRNADGKTETHEVEAAAEEGARAAMGGKGFEVIHVQRLMFTLPPLFGASRSLTIAEMAPSELGWLITKHVVIALAIWWVISLVLGFVLAGAFGTSMMRG